MRYWWIGLLVTAGCASDTQVTTFADVALIPTPPPGGLGPGEIGDAESTTDTPEPEPPCTDPSAEICNGLDDDCDGLTDDGFILSCVACADGDCIEATVVGGGWQDGVARNVLIGSDLGVHLPPPPAAQPHIFIANSNDNTVSKLRVVDGVEVARIYVGQDPSRTAVDGNGDAWVGMRASEVDCDGERCSKVVKLDGDCTPDAAPGEPTTECILLDLPRVGAKIRGVAVDAQGHAWIGTTDQGDVVQLHGETGEELQRNQLSPVCPVYGLALDESGYIWASCVDRYSPLTNEAAVVRYDPVLRKSDLSVPLDATDYGEPYGIAADGEGGIWLATFSNAVFRVDANTAEVGPIYKVGGQTRGVALDDSGRLWVADSSGNRVHRVDRAGVEPTLSVDVGQGPVGVAVDHLGQVWAVNTNSNNASRFDTDGENLQTFELGDTPYTYSDMTGAAFRVLRTLRGVFTSSWDAGFEASWTSVSFVGAAPPKTTVTLQVRKLGSASWQDIALDGNSGTITPAISAQSLEVRVELVTTHRPAIPNVLSLTFVLEKP